MGLDGKADGNSCNRLWIWLTWGLCRLFRTGANLVHPEFTGEKPAAALVMTILVNRFFDQTLF
jgi:hypothetical protein